MDAPVTNVPVMAGALITAGTVVVALGAGLVAGIFFAFSSFVMAALGRLRPEHGIAAMQSINVTVLNPWFFAVFFGTALGSSALVVLGIGDWETPGSAYLIAGGLLYLIGCIGVTVVCNVPLNNALAAVEPGSAAGAEVWARYRSRWTTWNHLRSGAALAASGSFIIAIVMAVR